MVQISRQYLQGKQPSENEDLREMRWYFTLESEQFLQFCNIFFEEVKAKQRTFKLILKHFSKLQYNYMKLFEEWTKNLFLLHLPLPVTIIIFF